MITKIVTAPSVEPVTLTEIKNHLRIDHSDHDTMLGNLIQASREWVERICSKALVEQTRAVLYKNWPSDNEFLLPYPPIQSVSSVKYTDTSGSTSTMLSDDYEAVIDDKDAPGKIVLGYNKTWPTATLHHIEYPITIEYVCGYEPDETQSPTDYRANIPESIKNAIKLDVELRYDRPPEKYSERLSAVIDILLAPYRVWGF